MILNALAAYKPKNSLPLGYAMKPVGFVLRILSDPLGCELIPRYVPQLDKEGKPTKSQYAPGMAVPYASRSNNPPPFLGCDYAPFVLGKSKDGVADKEREAAATKAKRLAFNELIGQWVRESQDSDGLTYLKWYEQGSPGLSDVLENTERIEAYARKRLDSDLIVLQVGDGELFVNKQSIQDFWGDQSLSPENGHRGRCLVCGQQKVVLETLPQALAGTRIPDTNTSQVALLSGNFASAQRGATGKGLRSAPICVACGTRAVQAFNELAASKDHRWAAADDRTATIWWTTDEEADGIFALLDNPEPERIKNLYISVLDPTIRRTDESNLDQFYALTFSGNVARLVIRSWIEMPLKDVERHLAQWFSDIATGDDRYPTLGGLARTAGTFVKKQGAWSQESPVGAFDALLRTALMGMPPPRDLLPRVLERACAEIHYQRLDDSKKLIGRRERDRLGLIRLLLNRNQLKEDPLTHNLDEGRAAPAYLSGRLFAIRERLQYLASGEVNSSIVDRFFGRASENPASVEHSLASLGEQHLRALERKNQKGAAIAIRKRIQKIYEDLPPEGVPGRLSPAQSAEWIAGYYQQKQYDIASAAAKKSEQDKIEE